MFQDENGGGGKSPSPWGDERFDFKFKKPDFNIDSRAILILVLVLLVGWAATGIYIVGPDSQAVIKRFGVPIGVVGPGPHYHMPYPIETVDKAQVTKIHRIEIGFRSIGERTRSVPEEALMLTGDENIVSIDLIVQYKIRDIEKYLYKVEDVPKTIKDAAEAAIREVAGKEKIDDILTVGKGRIQQETQDILQEMLDGYQAGTRVVAVQLQDVEPPQEVVASFKDVASAREDRNRFINEAEAYENELIPQARGEAATMLLEAEAYQNERTQRAIGDTTRFNDILRSYRVAPSVTRKRLYLETMEEVLGRGNKYIFDDSIENLSPILGLDALTNTKQGGVK